MATHKSAVKKVRQDNKRRALNRSHRSRLRGAVKKIRKAVDDGDTKGATEMLPRTLALIDRSVKLGVIHDNAAARAKSRIVRAVNKLA